MPSTPPEAGQSIPRIRITLELEIHVIPRLRAHLKVESNEGEMLIPNSNFEIQDQYYLRLQTLTNTALTLALNDLQKRARRLKEQRNTI